MYAFRIKFSVCFSVREYLLSIDLFAFSWIDVYNPLCSSLIFASVVTDQNFSLHISDSCLFVIACRRARAIEKVHYLRPCPLSLTVGGDTDMSTFAFLNCYSNYLSCIYESHFGICSSRLIVTNSSLLWTVSSLLNESECFGE